MMGHEIICETAQECGYVNPHSCATRCDAARESATSQCAANARRTEDMFSLW